MVLSKKTWIAAGIGAAVVTASLAPVAAAPFALSSAYQAPDMAEHVNWRGRRNGALVAGAIGLGILGIAAAAASERSYERRGYAPDYGYDQGYGYAPAYERPAYGYGYGYQQPSYDYAPAPVYRQRDVYDEERYYPRPRYRQTQRQNYHDYGRGLERTRDPAGNN